MEDVEKVETTGEEKIEFEVKNAEDGVAEERGSEIAAARERAM